MRSKEKIVKDCWGYQADLVDVLIDIRDLLRSKGEE